MRVGSLLVLLLLAGCSPPGDDDDDSSAADDDDSSAADDDDSSGGDDTDSSGGDDTDGLPSSYEIVWTGDILLADFALSTLETEGYLYPFEHLWELTEADTLIGNLEGPITTIDTPYNPNQTWSYNALPEAAPALAEFGFDAMSLANNHLMDRGPEGISDSQDHLRKDGVDPFGAGGDADEAATPLLVVTAVGTIAIVGMSEVTSNVPQAGAQSPGSHTFALARIQDSWARALAAGADYVVAYVHWGNNYAEVEEAQRGWAQAFADTGFDLVVGHGAHVPQEVDRIGEMVILYSLGNFTFGTPGRFDNDYPGYGLVARSSFGDDGLESIELHCILTDNSRVQFQPEPCPEEEAQEVLAGLGPLVGVVDGVGSILAR